MLIFMKLPFSAAQFFQSMGEYNSAAGAFVWLFYIAAIVVIVSLVTRKRFAVPVSLIFLSLLWIWMGVAYHWLIFSKINPAARLFAALFVFQGCVYLLAALSKQAKLQTGISLWRQAIALFFAFIALFVYPIVGYLNGHPYPNGPIFGLPCPTTIFTFGILMLLEGAGYSFLTLYGVPVIWSFIGTFAAINMKVYQDFFLIPVAVIALAFLIEDQRLRT